MKNICSKVMNIFKIVSKIVLMITVVILFFAAIYFATDFVFKNILSFNARAVLANFIVFSIIIAFALRQAVHPKAMLEQAQTIVENEIKDSEKAKEESDAELDTVQKSSRNVKKEINAILKKSEENAQNVGEKILQDAEKNAVIVKENAEKIIENNQNLLKNELIKRATLASVEVAKSHIINELNNNPELHNKLIYESIEAIIVNTETEVEEVEG